MRINQLAEYLGQVHHRCDTDTASYEHWTLTEEGIRLSLEIGAERRYRTLSNNGGRDFTTLKDLPWSQNIEGCAAEIIASASLGIEFPETIDIYRSEPDLGWFGGYGIDVKRDGRSLERPSFGLMIPHGYPADRIFVSITGGPVGYTVVGAYSVLMAQNIGLSNPGGLRACYLIPHRELRPISELRSFVHPSEVKAPA